METSPQGELEQLASTAILRARWPPPSSGQVASYAAYQMAKENRLAQSQRQAAKETPRRHATGKVAPTEVIGTASINFMSEEACPAKVIRCNEPAKEREQA